LFATKTRAEWCQVFDQAEVCFAPVLTASEAYENTHLQARETYVCHDAVLQAATAPRFSRTPGQIAKARDGRDCLASWGVSLA